MGEFVLTMMDKWMALDDSSEKGGDPVDRYHMSGKSDHLSPNDSPPNFEFCQWGPRNKPAGRGRPNSAVGWNGGIGDNLTTVRDRVIQVRFSTKYSIYSLSSFISYPRISNSTKFMRLIVLIPLLRQVSQPTVLHRRNLSLGIVFPRWVLVLVGVRLRRKS